MLGLHSAGVTAAIGCPVLATEGETFARTGCKVRYFLTANS